MFRHDKRQSISRQERGHDAHFKVITAASDSLNVISRNFFTGRVSGQDEPSAGFRSRIENDWARQEGTLNREISSVTALTELVERSTNLVNRLAEEELVESSELEKF